MHALIAQIFAADGGIEEHSKTAFYICGGALAVWAVVLSLIGMASETFPATATAQRGVIALTVLFVAAAMATAVITA